MNQIATVKSRWVAPTQIPVLASFWLWRDSRLTAAGGQLQALQRNVQQIEPGLIGGESRESRTTFVVTHLIDVEMTSQRAAVEDLTQFVWDVWSSKKSIMLAIGPADPARMNGTRDAAAKAAEEKVDMFDHSRYRPMVAYSNINNPYVSIDVAQLPGGQYPCSYQTSEVLGILTEPRDDPASPARFLLSPDCPLQSTLRSELDGILDTPSTNLDDLPQLAATTGALTAVMHGPFAPEPVTRKGGDDKFFDDLYNEITTRRD